MKYLLLALAFFSINQLNAQKKDTINIEASNLNTKVLQPGSNKYLVYFKMGKDSSKVRYQYWTRDVEYITYAGKPATRIIQQWEDNDTIIHTVNSICDRSTFKPLFHEFWWKRGAASFDFINNSAMMMGAPLLSTDTALTRKKVYDGFSSAINTYFLNWHLDLEVFSMLPYKENTTFNIRFYDPGTTLPAQYQPYTVSGSGTLTGYDKQPIDCWLLTHGEGHNLETFWVSKKTHEVLKLEQEFNGRYRYKVKIPI